MDSQSHTLDTLREEAHVDLMGLVAWAPAWAFALATVVHAVRTHVAFGAEETLALAAVVLVALHGLSTAARHVRLRAARPRAPEPQGIYR